MSPIVSTKLHFEKQLNTALGNVISLENVPFNPETLDTYYRVQFVIGNPYTKNAGLNYYRENIQMQVFVCQKKSKGTVEALNLAENLRSLFPKGYSAVKDGYTMHILTTPRIGSADPVESRCIIPVFFDIITEVYQ